MSKQVYFQAFLAVLLGCGPGLLHAEISPPNPGTRPILQASLRGLYEFGASPSRIQKEDVPLLVFSGMGLGLLLGTELDLYARMAKGDARKEWLDQSMPVVSTAGEGWVELAAIGLGYWLGDERLRNTSGIALQSLAVAAVYTAGLKAAAWSNRPYQDDTRHRYLAYDQNTQGMPSGHSFTAFAVAEVYGAEYGRWLPYSLAVLIAYSRIYNHAHWPSDVYVGSALGILAGRQARSQALEHGTPALRLSALGESGAPGLLAELSF